MASATTSNYLYTAYMNFILRGGSFTPPASVYVALFTSAPSIVGTGGTEVASNATTKYARVEVRSVSSNWTAPSGSNLEISNVNEITFAVPGDTWGTIVAAGLYDAATGGNLLWVGNIGTSKPVQNGDGAPRILANQLKISRAVC